ncbi:MAG: acyl-CoA-binding protein [Lysobacter sp.]
MSEPHHDALTRAFEQAAKDIHALDERPDNETLLRLYGLYKQGAEGDVSGPKPGFFDFVGTAKYEAWAKLKGTAQPEAMQQYVDLVGKLRG